MSFLPISDPTPNRAEYPVQTGEQKEDQANLLRRQSKLPQMWLQRWVQEGPSVGHNHDHKTSDYD